MSIEIPKQLQNTEFRFIRLNGKIPIDNDWTNNNNFDYEDLKIKTHNNNLGILCGRGKLCVIDIDGNGESTLEEINKVLPKTYTVKTGKQGFHLYYITDEIVKTTTLNFNDSHIDIKAKGGQVVIAGSLHPETKKYYESYHDVPLEKIPKDDILKLFKLNEKNGITFKKASTDDESRSATEYREICRQISKGKTKEQIYNYMTAFDKWAASKDSYKEYTYNKARAFIDKAKKDPVNDDNIKYRVLEYMCDTNRDTKADSHAQAEEILVGYLINKFHIKTLQQDESLEMWGYNQGIYINAGQSLIRESLREILGKAFSQTIVTKVINKISADTYITSKDFFKNDYPYILPVKNGLLDLRTLELNAFNPDKIFFTKLPVEYRPDKKCKNIEIHLNDVLKNSEDLDLFIEAVGNCLIKKYTYQKAVMLVGNGRNGKGVTLDLIIRLLGADNCSGISLEQLEGDQYALSELHGKLSNLGGDLSKTALNNTGKFKTATGGDLLTAPRKFLTPLYFVNYAKFFFACNELPMINDNSRGFWDRWLYFDFPFTFVTQEEYNNKPKEEQKNYKIANPKIKDEIFNDDELSGFLNLAISGMKRLIKNNKFSHSKTFEEVKTKWIRQSDSFKAFCLDYVEIDWEGRMPKKELRKTYTLYCKKNNIRPMSDKYINHVLTTEYGVESKQVTILNNLERVWEGIKFKLK